MVKSVSRGQTGQFFAKVATLINWEILDGDRFQTEVLELSSEEFGNKLTAFLQSSFGKSPLQSRTLLNFTWAYHELGLDQAYADFLTANPPQSVDGHWDIPVIKGVTPNKVVNVIRGLGVDMSLYTSNLNRSVTTNDRDPKNGSYWIRCKANIEADKENKNLSANMLAEQHIQGLTLLERLLLELAYYLATTDHLDIKNITLCSGSRSSDGRVPIVYWGSDYSRVCVDLGRSGSMGGDLRARTCLPAGRQQLQAA